MTFITTSQKQTARYVTALPSSVQKEKQNRITKDYLLKQNKAVHPHLSWTLPLEVAVRQNKSLKSFFLLMLWFGTDNSAIKSSNTKILARTCPIRAKAVNQVFTWVTMDKHICDEICTAKIDAKIDLIYFARTALIVLAAKKGQRNRQALLCCCIAQINVRTRPEKGAANKTNFQQCWFFGETNWNTFKTVSTL